jgi:hypothetical protein
MSRYDRPVTVTVRMVLLVMVAWLIVVSGSVAGFVGLTRIAQQNRANGALLIDCTTPSTPDKTHVCWDRLRAGDSGTSDAVRRLYCIPLVLAGYRPAGEPLDCSDVAALIETLPR